MPHAGFNTNSAMPAKLRRIGIEKPVRKSRSRLTPVMLSTVNRYHNVNFGESNVPMDKWFGSLHDGSPEADDHFREVNKQRLRAKIN